MARPARVGARSGTCGACLPRGGGSLLVCPFRSQGQRARPLSHSLLHFERAAPRAGVRDSPAGGSRPLLGRLVGCPQVESPPSPCRSRGVHVRLGFQPGRSRVRFGPSSGWVRPALRAFPDRHDGGTRAVLPPPCTLQARAPHLPRADPLGAPVTRFCPQHTSSSADGRGMGWGGAARPVVVGGWSRGSSTCSLSSPLSPAPASASSLTGKPARCMLRRNAAGSTPTSEVASKVSKKDVADTKWVKKYAVSDTSRSAFRNRLTNCKFDSNRGGLARMMVYTSRGKKSSAPGGAWAFEEEVSTLLITRQQFITQISLSPGALYWFTFCSSFWANTQDDSSQYRGGISRFDGFTKSNAPIFADSSASRSLSSALTPKDRSYSLIITYFSKPSNAASSSSGDPSRHSGCFRKLASICCRKRCTFWLPNSTGGWLRLYHCKKLVEPRRIPPSRASAPRPFTPDPSTAIRVEHESRTPTLRSAGDKQAKRRACRSRTSKSTTRRSSRPNRTIRAPPHVHRSVPSHRVFTGDVEKGRTRRTSSWNGPDPRHSDGPSCPGNR
eukprot:scaffold373_cov350-Pavlova_lutheri.AAC.39